VLHRPPAPTPRCATSLRYPTPTPGQDVPSPPGRRTSSSTDTRPP
jgi:hypothetical protein